MNPPQFEVPNLSPASQAYGGHQGEWATEECAGILEKGNLIYLPFARHLADEDETPIEKAA